VAASPAATDNSHSAIFDSPRPPCSNARFPTTSQPASITHTRCVCEPQSTPTNQCCFNGHLLALPWIHGPQLHGLRILQRPLGQVTRPIVHQDTPAFEQVRAGIVRLDPVPDHMRQGRLDHPPGDGLSPHPPSPGRSGGSRWLPPQFQAPAAVGVVSEFALEVPDQDSQGDLGRGRVALA